jgi:hypothetical protein
MTKPQIFIPTRMQLFTNMSIKHKITNTMIEHPKIITFGIGLSIAFMIGIAIGMLARVIDYSYNRKS